MSWLLELARRGRLSDRLTRLAVRRLTLRHLARATALADRAPAGRHDNALEPPDLPAPWRPGEPPSWVPRLDLEDLFFGYRGLEAAAHWPAWAKDLPTAVDEMLHLIRQRAEIEARHRVLLVAGRRAAAASYLADEIETEPVIWTPRTVDADHIRERARRAGLAAREVHAGTLEDSLEEATFDRALVIESVPPGEDTRSFLTRLGRCLRPGGRLFLQLPCHRRYTYRVSGAEGRWLGLRSGALIPATDLPPKLVDGLVTSGHWELSGEHYERTARAWRHRLESNRARLVALVGAEIGESAARRAVADWRLALLAREEMFGLRGGQEWWISHSTFDRREP